MASANHGGADSAAAKQSAGDTQIEKRAMQTHDSSLQDTSSEAQEQSHEYEARGGAGLWWHATHTPQPWDLQQTSQPWDAWTQSYERAANKWEVQRPSQPWDAWAQSDAVAAKGGNWWQEKNLAEMTRAAEEAAAIEAARRARVEEEALKAVEGALSKPSRVHLGTAKGVPGRRAAADQGMVVERSR